MSNARKLPRQQPDPGDEQALLTWIYCEQCDRTYLLSAAGNDEVIEGARRGDERALARMDRFRADWLTTHQMECA